MMPQKNIFLQKTHCMQNIGSLGLETPGLLECSDFSILHVTFSYLAMVSIWLGFQKTALIIQLIPKMAATQKKTGMRSRKTRS